MKTLPKNLYRIMTFDHVILVLDGYAHNTGFRAPALYDGEISAWREDAWTLMDGWSGQDGYTGPIMHPSEYIGGRLARHILATDGLYVALVNKQYKCSSGDDCESLGYCSHDDDDEPDGWAIAFRAIDTIPRYRSIDDIKARNRQAGFSFFGEDEKRFFNSIVSDTIYPVRYGAYFVTSEKSGYDGVRGYTVRFADLAGATHSASEFQQYRSSSGAHAAARRFATQYADTNPNAETTEES